MTSVDILTLAMVGLAVCAQLVLLGRAVALPRSAEPLFHGGEPELVRDLLRGVAVLRAISRAYANRLDPNA